MMNVLIRLKNTPILDLFFPKINLCVPFRTWKIRDLHINGKTQLDLYEKCRNTNSLAGVGFQKRKSCVRKCVRKKVHSYEK